MYVPHFEDLQGVKNERFYFCSWVRNECKYCDAKVREVDRWAKGRMRNGRCGSGSCRFVIWEESKVVGLGWCFVSYVDSPKRVAEGRGGERHQLLSLY
jgi:hypothetical protein